MVATGEIHSVREFAEKVFDRLDIPLEWRGQGAHETGIDTKTGKTVVEVDPKYFRPAEVDLLLGDLYKARQKLDWKPRTDFDGLVSMTAAADIKLAEQELRTGEA